MIESPASCSFVTTNDKANRHVSGIDSSGGEMAIVNLTAGQGSHEEWNLR